MGLVCLTATLAGRDNQLHHFTRGELPCDMTAERKAFVVELANQYYGYLPTPEQHKLGGYETWPARSSSLAEDGESRILSILRQVAETP